MSDLYAEYLNYRVFLASVRINSMARFMTVVDNGGRIAPDVAAAAMLVQEREQRVFGNLRAELQARDASANATYRSLDRNAARNIPAGVSVLQGIYNHDDLFQSAPVIEHSWLWTDMPLTNYQWARTDLSASDREVLRGLGFEESYNIAQSGGKCYTPNQEAIAIARGKRIELFGEDTVGSSGKVINPAWFSEAMKVARYVGLTVLAISGVAAIPYVIACIAKEISNFVNRDEIALQRRNAEIAANASRVQVTQAESLAQALSECTARQNAGLATADECARLATALAAIRPITSIEPLPGTACGFWSCWPWAIGALALSGYLAHKWATKKGYFQ